MLVGQATVGTLQSGSAYNANEYEICKVRGHVPTILGNTHLTMQNAVFIAVPDSPASKYVTRAETEWETCFYCKKQFRFVTTLEEK